MARVYDFYLGGSHNFESDRAFGAAVLGQFPELGQTARDNRAFLRRVVARLGAQGIDQFLDRERSSPAISTPWPPVAAWRSATPGRTAVGTCPTSPRSTGTPGIRCAFGPWTRWPTAAARHGGRTGAARLAAQSADALVGTSHTSMGRSSLRTFLTGPAEVLVAGALSRRSGR